MTAPAAPSQPRFDDMGLSAFSFKIAADRECVTRPGFKHTHMELEMVLVQKGVYGLDIAGQNEQVSAGEVAVYWAGFPHRGGGESVGALFHVAQMPIVLVLSWIGSAALMDHLLSGRVLRTEARAGDISIFSRWSTDLATGDPQLRAIVELEMQARLRRCLHRSAGTSPTPVEPTGTATARGVALAIQYVVRHYMEHITVDDVAEAVGWHRVYLMQSFHQVCGLTLWEYVTRVRLAEAQRLLVATDLPILTICHRAGFSSTSRMYDAFGRCYGLTPSEYREVVRG